MSIKDICRLTGLSTATVSRAIHDSPLVTDATKKRVREAMAQIGYVPHHAARALKLKRTGLIAVVFPDLDNGFFTEVLRGIDEMAAEFNYHLMTSFLHGPRDDRTAITRLARERRADAIILMNLCFPIRFLRDLGQVGVPTVLIDKPLPSCSMPAVVIDNRSGVRAMTAHLVEQGFRRIVFVAGPRGTYDADQRLAEFRQAAAEAEISPTSDIWFGDFTEASGHRLMKQFLDQNRDLPDAIFAANDAMAIGVLRALRETGRRVPQDVAVAGFDGIDVARHLGLTTIQVPMRMLGRTAARLAIDKIRGLETPARVVMPVRLEVRTSALRAGGSGLASRLTEEK
jgi:LacI family transcriptional regulator